MKGVKFAGYQHRYWLQQQREMALRQERMVEQLVRELELMLATNNALQVGKALIIIANLRSSMAKSAQIIDEMNQRVCKPESETNVESEGLIVSILEKLHKLEEIVMKSP